MTDISRPFQRIGAPSNAQAGDAFELIAQRVFLDKGIHLSRNFKLAVGANMRKKEHAFDWGNEIEKLIVECKSHTWTATSKIPSAKMTVWNEAMFYFHLAPADYQKVMFVLRHTCQGRSETLAEYYIRQHGHLVPENVEFWD